MRYFTSDTHYGHANIIRFCGRPYSGVDEMNADLVHRAASVLSAGDELWHLGDVALGRLHDTLPHLAEITGDLTLVAGNHDRCHPSNGARSERFVEVYREKCRPRELILTCTRLTLTNGEQVQVSHFPYAEANPGPAGAGGVDPSTDRFAAWRPVDDGSWLLCGHVHEKWRQRGKMINVGVDAWGGNPVRESDICSLMAAGPRHLPPLPWP